jgi:hypothetical protein
MENVFEGLKDIKFDEIENKEFIKYKELCRSDAQIRNSTFIECPHCKVVGNEPNMLRWHFDNCTTTFRNCEQCNGIIPRQGTKPFQYDVKKYCNRKCYMDSKKGKPPIVMTDEVKNKLSVIRKKWWKNQKSS